MAVDQGDLPHYGVTLTKNMEKVKPGWGSQALNWLQRYNWLVDDLTPHERMMFDDSNDLVDIEPCPYFTYSSPKMVVYRYVVDTLRTMKSDARDGGDQAAAVPEWAWSVPPRTMVQLAHALYGGDITKQEANIKKLRRVMDKFKNCRRGDGQSYQFDTRLKQFARLQTEKNTPEQGRTGMPTGTD